MRKAIFIAIAALWSNNVLAQDSFAEKLNDCAAQFTGNIDRSSIERLGDSLSGAYSLDVGQFLSFFPEDQRIEAYRLYTDCLSKQLESSSDGATIFLPDPGIIAVAGDESGSSIEISSSGTFRFFDFVENRTSLPVTLYRICEVTLQTGKENKVPAGFQFKTKSGSEITGADGRIGARHGPTTMLLPARALDLSFQVYPSGTSGFVDAIINFDCS